MERIERGSVLHAGGPVFNEIGQCVGIAFQSMAGQDAENIGYVIPTPVINHFLTDYKYAVFPVTHCSLHLEQASIQCSPKLCLIMLLYHLMSSCKQAQWAIHWIPSAGGEVAAHGECWAQGILWADAAHEGGPDQEHLADLAPGRCGAPG